MNNAPLRIFIGYDPRQPISYNVLQQSIAIRSTVPVAIMPLILEQLPIKRRGLTPFTWSRFLVPWICKYHGWALFLDSDMLVMDDISKLFGFADAKYDVMVRKSPWRFEWASAILFNNSRCKKLTPEFVEQADGLHGMKWTEKVGELPKEWNHIVFYDDENPEASLIHYTGGIPIYPETRGCEWTDDYLNDAKMMSASVPWKTLMGGSVHVAKVQDHLEKRKAANES